MELSVQVYLAGALLLRIVCLHRINWWLWLAVCLHSTLCFAHKVLIFIAIGKVEMKYRWVVRSTDLSKDFRLRRNTGRTEENKKICMHFRNNENAPSSRRNKRIFHSLPPFQVDNISHRNLFACFFLSIFFVLFSHVLISELVFAIAMWIVN